MSTFSDLKKEIETIVRFRVEKAINRMNLVKRDEFEALKKVVQNLATERKKSKKNPYKSVSKKKSKIKRKK